MSQQQLVQKPDHNAAIRAAFSTIQPTGPCPAKVMIVAEAPSQEDEKKGLPLSGYSGDEFGRMLVEAGLNRSTCFTTVAIRVRPPSGYADEAFFAESKRAITPSHVQVRDKMVLPPVVDGLEMLKREIELCRPNVIIALGNIPMWMLTGKWGITSWRGSMLKTDLALSLDYQPKVLPTYAPSAVRRKWDWRPIAVTDLRRAAGMAATKELILPDYKFIIRPSYSTALTTLNKLLSLADLQPDGKKLKLADDIETRAGHIACIGVAWSAREAMCIPLMCLERPEGYWTEEQETMLLHKLYTLYTHEKVEIVGQNHLYDDQYFLRHLCFKPNVARDIMLTQHTMFSNLQKSLDFQASMYLPYYCYWKAEGKEWNTSIPEDEYWTYNCKDAVQTFELDDVEQPLIDRMRLRAVHDFQQKLYHPVLKTMERGLRVDTARRQAFYNQLKREIEEREEWIREVLGRDINISSPTQLQQLFYHELKFKPILHRKTKTLTTDEEAMRKMMAREPLVGPLIRKILEIRSLNVFQSTFVSAPLDVDGRMRCSYNIAGTDTFRFNSRKNAFGSGMNLQNVPSGGEMDDGFDLVLPNIRTLFVPDPGMEFFDIDLSSADLRIVVWESDEGEMKAMLAQGLDPYTEIAKEFYHDQSITKKDPRRQIFKSFAHGTHYLGTPEGLAERLGLPVQMAKDTQAWYFKRFPRIKKWQDEAIRDGVTKRRMVQNIFGYRMHFFDRIEGTVLNQAAAWIPQSTVGCLINRAYVAIDEKEPEVEILLQVHDSLAGQYPIAKRDEILPRILQHAAIPLPYDDPLVIPVGVKTSTVSWGDCS